MKPKINDILIAAQNADWQQVILNGGNPCFHLYADRKQFCLRAQRWAGHECEHKGDHEFITLDKMLASALRVFYGQGFKDGQAMQKKKPALFKKIRKILKSK